VRRDDGDHPVVSCFVGIFSGSNMGVIAFGVAVLLCSVLVRCGVAASCVGNISEKAYSALESLYNATAGWNWNWDSTQPNSTIWRFPCNISIPCSFDWQGLACTWSSDAALCEVNGISLATFGMYGVIPSEIGNLVNLNYLYLYDNLLSGTLPSELGDLSSLQYLYLYINSLEGPLPSELGRLSGLIELQLEINQIDGSIPPELGNMSSLEVLYLYDNLLSGSLSAGLGRLSSLTALYIYENLLSGAMPSELGHLSSLQYLYLYINSLEGPLPSELGRLSRLIELQLDINQIEGSIPRELFNMSSLEVLYLYDNLLSGTLPSELGDLSSLQYLYLYINSLEGSLPSELGNMSSLEVLYLNNNLFSGTLSSELGDLSSLQYLYLYINSLEGPLPSELGRLSGLIELQLEINQIDGSIPPELGNMSSLEVLYLYDNLLSGSLSAGLGRLSSLTALYIYENLLSGAMPSELGHLSSLQYLYLYINSLEGPLPSELGRLSRLIELQLDINQIEGSIPRELFNMSSLEVLYLYDNLLSGTLSSELSNLRNLGSLYLYDNALNGTIPSELGQLSGLLNLQLQENFLEGTIASELCNMLKLQSLFLYDNLLVGTIPSEMGELLDLASLLMYSNSLVGTIPSELGNLVDISSFELNTNSLTGTIPTQLGLLTKAETFMLSSNSLSGRIPFELCGLERLVTLALSDNSLSGTFPFVMDEWPVLQSLNLSTNRLTGSIDSLNGQNGSLQQLLVLDISNNQFTGNISDSVFLLPSIQTVILSQNCFHGTLPSSICASARLTNVVLDLLTGNCGDAVQGFRGFVLRHYIPGTIPSCIWNSTSIKVLHLLGNGLVGSLADLSNDSSFVVVGLGSNQLTGTIPISFQRRSFTQLDLSINRLSGTLASDLFINETSTTVYDLSANRLSGGIPAALYVNYSSGIINVLEGNLFGCQQSNIPLSDAYHDTYQCGSFDLQYSLLIWIVSAGAVGIAFTIMTSVGGVLLTQYFSVAKSRIYLGVLYGPLSCMTVSVAALFVFVTVKLVGKHADLSTHSVQYWWTTTVIYLHDGFVCAVVFVVLALMSAIFTIAIMSLTRDEKQTVVQVVETPCANKTAVFSRQAAAHAVNISVVTLVNALYILVAVENLNGYALLALQAALGIFKLAWCSVIVPLLVARSVTNGSHRLPHWMFMVLYVFLGAPFMSTFCESNSCFLYVLTQPSQIVFSYAIESVATAEECTSICHVNITRSYQTVQSSVLAPWIYSYQCSSAVIVSYAPVLILSYLVSGILVPFGVVVSNYSTRLFALAKKLFPLMVYHISFDENIFENTAQQQQQSLRRSILSVMSNRISISDLGRKMVIKYILNLAVMLTFGLAVPLLNIAVLCDTAFSLATVIVSIHRSIELDNTSGLASAKAIQEFWVSFDLPSDTVAGCCCIVLGYVSMFWSLFVFDWIGDVYGSLPGGLAMLVPLILPSLVGYGLLRTKKIRERLETVSQTSVAIELGGGISPLILPQNTNDNFERSM
jgi:Leucine-rich repeat (LRR) protein